MFHSSALQDCVADSQKLVGTEYPGIKNFGQLFKLLFQMLPTFTNKNRELEGQLAELEVIHFPLTEKTSTLSRVEIEEVWELYDNECGTRRFRRLEEKNS